LIRSLQAASGNASRLLPDTNTHTTVAQEELQNVCSFTTSDPMSRRIYSACENEQNMIVEEFRSLTTFCSSRPFQCHGLK
jgi:hypothetical protein